MTEVLESLEHLTVKSDDDAATNASHNQNSILNRVGQQDNESKFNFTLAAEEAVSLKQNYILSICATSDPEFRIAAAFSDYSCSVYTVGETLSRVATFNQNQSLIIGIKFSTTHQNLLYTACSDGCIMLYDLRSNGRPVTQYQANNSEDTVRQMKNLASFAIAPDERIMAGGTEFRDGDSFILFWDTRYPTSKAHGKRTTMGGYWESHTDDVTTLEFHSTRKDILASGSTDGLINIFDLTQPSEDSALMHSLNTESSVDRLGWLGEERLWCGTHTNALQLWDCEGAAPYAKFERDAIANFQNEEPDNCYLVKMHTNSAMAVNFFLSGCTANKRESLRCMTVRDGELEVCCLMTENKQIVRDSWYQEKNNCLVTGGENSIVSIWKYEEPGVLQSNCNNKLHSKTHKAKGRERLHKMKPY